MAINTKPVPTTALTDQRGWATPAFLQWFNSLRAAFAAVPAAASGDIWRGRRVQVLEVSPGGTEQGLGMVTNGGGTFPAPTSTSFYTSMPRHRIPCAAVANSQTVFAYNASPGYWLGNAAGLGGFRFEMAFGVDTAVATTRIACGLFNAAPVITVTEPSSKTDCIFLGADSTDANMQIMYNDSAGACTKTDLGANFPVAANACYRLVLQADHNATSVAYTVTRMDNTTVAAVTGTLLTNIPANTTFFGPILAIGNAGTAAAAALGLFRIMVELDYPQ